MKKHLHSLLAAATVLVLGGCLPEEFVWWSPDGQTLAVRTQEGLRLSNASGVLTEVVLPGEIQSAAWLSDGTGIVVSRSWNAKDWTAAEKVAPSNEVAFAREMAAALPGLLKAALSISGGSLEEASKKFVPPSLSENKYLDLSWLCAVNLYRDQLLAVVAGFPNAASLREEVLSITNLIAIHELTFLPLANGQPGGEPRALARSLLPLLDPVVSPSHPVLAYRTEEGALKAMRLDGKASLTVTETDVRYAAWSPDGLSIFYIAMGKSDKVGEIVSRTVINAKGELNESGSETLAMAAFPGAPTPPRLSVLPNGNVLFASLPITFPAPASVDVGARFYLLNPLKRDVPPVPVEIMQGSLPEDLSTFSVSPDGKLVAVVEGGTDAVAVLELAIGQVKIISPSHADWKSRLIPAWRNNQELSFAALPAPNAQRPELILWSTNAPERILSKDWPTEVVDLWLKHEPKQK